MVNQLQSTHQSPNEINCSKSPSSQHLLNGTSNYHQNVSTNTSEANKNSCETNRIYVNTPNFNSKGHIYWKKSEQQRQRRYHKRAQVAANSFPENHDLFKKPNVMSGNSTSKNE